MKQHETAENSQGQLYIVPTPIGNLSDITQRALTVLQAVDLIAAEDTRHTGLLLQHFAINARLFALHDHNEQQKAETLVAKLKEGQNIALVSDAGTPLINDPGYHLVRTCREAGIRVVPLPGPCAAIAALSAAGLPSDRFCYEGFLPAKSKGRRDVLKELEAEPRTLIFYESTHRLLESLEDMVTVWGERRYVVLARELTKTWETIHGAPVGELLAWVKEDENRRKGEMVLIVEGHKAEEDALPADALRTLALLQAELPLKKAAALAAEIHGVKKNALYKYALEQQGSKSYSACFCRAALRLPGLQNPECRNKCRKRKLRRPTGDLRLSLNRNDLSARFAQQVFIVFSDPIIRNHTVNLLHRQHLIKPATIKLAGIQYGNHFMGCSGHHAADRVAFIEGGDTVCGINAVSPNKH